MTAEDRSEGQGTSRGRAERGLQQMSYRSFRLVSKLRFMSFAAVFFSFVGAALMFFVGGKKVSNAVWYYATSTRPETAPAHQTAADLATIQVIASLDSFLIGLALLYFGYGIYSLMFDFEEVKAVGAPAWLIPRDLKDLKETLAHVILLILFVLFVDVAWIHLHDATWEMLVLPASIALLALALNLMQLKREK